MSVKFYPDKCCMGVCRYVLFLIGCLLALSGCTIDLTVLESMNAKEDQVLLVATSNKTCLKTEDSGPRCFGDEEEAFSVSYKNPLSDEEIVDLQGGYSHRCVLTASGKAYCWGTDSSGSLGAGRSLSFPSSVYTPVEVQMTGSLQGKSIASLAVGRSSTCSLDTDGGISCWGNNAYGQLGIGTTTTSVIPAAVDATGVLAGKKIVKIVAQGSYHICALDDEGAAYCWGDNSDGQVGDNSGVAKVLVPAAVDMSGALAGKRLIDITMGDKHTCAIADDKKAYCWGSNANGALGIKQSSADVPSVSTPQAVYTGGALNGKDIVKIEAGISLTCALTSDGIPYCWGNDSSGQLGNGTPKSASSEPVAVKVTGVLNGKSIVDIHVGRYHGCVRDDRGASYCWGSGASGSLGDNATAQQPEPVATILTSLKSTEGFISLALENNRSCGLSNKGNLYCWGSTSLSDGSTVGFPTLYGWDNSAFPDEELKYIRSMSVGKNQTCYVSLSYRVFCVGNNTNGVLGIGGSVTSSNKVVAPVPVDASDVLSGKKIIEVHAAADMTYALSDDGKLFLWGSNLYGGFGNGTSGGVSGLPLAVDLGEKRIKEVAAGEMHVCVLTFDKDVYCWGANMYGQVGAGLSDITVAQPTKVAGLLAGKKIKTISTFYAHTCALTEDDRLYCWGLNYGSIVPGGIIGGGSADAITEPLEVSMPTELEKHHLISLSTSMLSTCVLTEKGKAYCWGSNSLGQLGVAGIASTTTPTAVETNKIFTKLVSGQVHTCGYSTDKKVYCWGDNSKLQLGDALFVDAFSAEPRLVNGL